MQKDHRATKVDEDQPSARRLEATRPPRPDDHRSKVARVEGWEPFEQIERSELDDH